jgi:hypothetical protein
MLAKTSAANFVSVPSTAMAERRDTFLVMVQAPGLCMEGTAQGGKPQLSHDMIGMGHFGARSVPVVKSWAIASNGRSRRHYARTPCKSQKEECVQAGPDSNRRRQAALADALATVESTRASRRARPLWPTIAAALATKHHWMVDRRPDLNLSMKHPTTPTRPFGLRLMTCGACASTAIGEGMGTRASAKADVLTANKLGNGIRRYHGVNWNKRGLNRNFERKCWACGVWNIYSCTSLIPLRTAGISPMR